jgi:NADH:quinone reductase (non-electrogenic)
LSYNYRPLNFLLGLLTALTQPNPAALRDAIRETRKLTSKPFGVNITLLPSINPPDYEGYARAAVEEGVKIFETAGNNRSLGYCDP